MSFDISPLAISALAALAGGTMLAMFLWRGHRYKSPAALKLEAMKSDYVRAGLGARVSALHGGAIVTGTIAGSEFRLVSIQDSHRGMTRLSVFGHARGSFDLSYAGSRTLSGGDRIAERFADPGAQQAVRSLFALGFGNVGRNRKGAFALAYGPAIVPTLLELEAAVRQLSTVREAEIRLEDGRAED